MPTVGVKARRTRMRQRRAFRDKVTFRNDAGHRGSSCKSADDEVVWADTQTDGPSNTRTDTSISSDANPSSRGQNNATCP